MVKVTSTATPWPAFYHTVEGIVRELIVEHCRPVIAEALAGGQVIPFENRIELWLSFLAQNPALRVDEDEFSEVLNRALGRPARRLIRRKR